MGQAWIRWVHASVPDDAVSYARLRVLTALEGNPDGLTMSGIAAALGVTGRRVTVLVDALVNDGLVADYLHPTDGRSTMIEITDRPAGPSAQGMATASAHYLRRSRPVRRRPSAATRHQPHTD